MQRFSVVVCSCTERTPVFCDVPTQNCAAYPTHAGDVAVLRQDEHARLIGGGLAAEVTLQLHHLMVGLERRTHERKRIRHATILCPLLEQRNQHAVARGDLLHRCVQLRALCCPLVRRQMLMVLVVLALR